MILNCTAARAQQLHLVLGDVQPRHGHSGLVVATPPRQEGPATAAAWGRVGATAESGSNSEFALRFACDHAGRHSDPALHAPAFSSPVYVFREHELRFLVTGHQSGGSYSLMEITSPLGSGPDLHTHDEAEEHFVVLEGELSFQVGTETFTAARGDLVARGVAHAFTVRSDRARTLATYTPAGEEVAFMNASVLADD